jgi:hypothetical protein
MKNMMILLRILAIIPFLTGSLLLYERTLPDEVIETSIISKKVKTEDTEGGRKKSTYTVYFEGLHEQVSRQMYEIMNEGDVIQLKVTPYFKHVRFFKINERVGWIENATGERLAIFIFALAYFFGAIGVLFKKERFSIGGFIAYAGFIIISIMTLGQMDL